MKEYKKQTDLESFYYKRRGKFYNVINFNLKQFQKTSSNEILGWEGAGNRQL
jgi:hypothetical protein